MDSKIIAEYYHGPEIPLDDEIQGVLTIEQINSLSDFINWKALSTDSRLTENFIHHFSNKLSWESIIKNISLSTDFIRDHRNVLRLYWDEISRFQSLSEEFIKQFKFHVHWDKIKKYQNVSKEFIKNECPDPYDEAYFLSDSDYDSD